MAVTNSGNGVVVDSGGVTLAGFTTAAASNIKVQDSTLYTITTNAIGGNANGSLAVQKSIGAIAQLDGTHTILCTNALLASGADNENCNATLSIKGAKLVMTSDSGMSEGTAPITGDDRTQIIYRSNGTTWNSQQAGVNLDGANLVFAGNSGGDGHLGRHPSATVKNTKLTWLSTSPNTFVLAANQCWGTDNKPSAMDGFDFLSISGNNLVSIFTMTTQLASGARANNYFYVCKDWSYNVALPNTRPAAIKRSYRRGSTTASASSYWGSVSICPTLLYIDLKTTLSASGVKNSDPTYLRAVSYAEAGVGGSDDTTDVLSLRFSPTVTSTTGVKLGACSVVVLNTNSNCSASNAIGNFRARLAASGITNSTGKFVITEPSTKDYTSNTSHRSDSIVIRNRTRTQAWHKWWEAGVKLINIADSRNGLGSTAPESYAATDYTVSYRVSGYQFSSSALDMSAPQSPTVALSSDANYNQASATAGITVSYASGVTTVNLADGSYTADGIWKAVIDFHVHPDRNESESVLPFTSWSAGEMQFSNGLIITGSPAAIINEGTKISKIVSSKSEAFGTAGNPKVNVPFEDVNGVRVTVKAPTPTTDFNISARYGTTTFTNLGFFTATGEITFTVPKGQPLEVAIWAFSYSTYVTTIDTTDGGSIFTAPLAINTAVDTTLNVDSYLSKIALSLNETGATPKLVLTVNEPMTISGIELGKAITHKVAGLQVALTAALTFGDVTPLDIEPTEILNNLPAFSLVVGTAVTASQRVYFDFFINTAPAIAIDPTYVLNPIRADGNQVQILRVKPDIDPAQMAAGVIAGGVATSAQVLARPTLAEIEVAGGKLDTAMKAAKSAKLNTMG